MWDIQVETRFGTMRSCWEIRRDEKSGSHYHLLNLWISHKCHGFTCPRSPVFKRKTAGNLEVAREEPSEDRPVWIIE